MAAVQSKTFGPADWDIYNPDESCTQFELDKHAQIMFIDGTVEQFPLGIRANQLFRRGDQEGSLCKLYIDWLFRNRKHNYDPPFSRFVDLRTKKGKQDMFFFFKTPGFFNNTLPYPSGYSTKPQDNAFLFPKNDSDESGGDAYDVGGQGIYETLQGLAFYYLKVLPVKLQKHAHINRSIIVRRAEMSDDVPSYIEQIATFIKDTPENTLGISLMSYLDHAALLVYDPVEKRLEFYDPVGIGFNDDNVFAIIAEERVPGEVYGAMVRWNQMFDAIPGEQRICKIWGSTFQFQTGPFSMDCTLWTSMIAICRMSGISRDRLPTKRSDQFSIMSMIREIMWNDCQFSKFGKRSRTFAQIDKALQACQVPELKKEKLLHLVMSHAMKTPIPIPPDTELCGKMEDPQKCKNLTINVNEVDVGDNFVTYIKSLCHLKHVTVILPDILTYDESLELIVEAMIPHGTLTLELPNVPDLRDADIQAFFSELLKLNTIIIKVGGHEFLDAHKLLNSMNAKMFSNARDVSMSPPSPRRRPYPTYIPTFPGHTPDSEDDAMDMS